MAHPKLQIHTEISNTSFTVSLLLTKKVLISRPYIISRMKKFRRSSTFSSTNANWRIGRV